MPTENKKMTFITHARFWQGGAGYWARSHCSILYLTLFFQLRVIYIGRVTEADREIIRQMNAEFEFLNLDDQIYDTIPARLNKLKKMLKQSDHADFYFIDKTENAYAVDILPERSIKILDTHDLIHKRNASLHTCGINDPFRLTSTQENDIFSRFDAVICIQQDDYQTVKQWQGPYKTLLVTHALSTNEQLIATKATRIGIVASAWHANIHGLHHFLEHIWPHIHQEGVSLHLYGYITDSFQHLSQPDICLHGYQANLGDCYKNIDIAINPVYYGAGLKIKSIEAMAHGIPLVTTAEGASGLLPLSDKALLVADNDAQFITGIKKVLHDFDLRQRLARHAIRHVKQNHNTQTCFSPLLDFLQTD